MSTSSPAGGALRILITGGAGFLGQAIVRELLRPERSGLPAPAEIRSFDLREAPAVGGVTSRLGDVRDLDALLEACRGVDCVLHAASLVDWGRASEEELESVNVGGTENALRACREAGVPALVYTSTMDVIYGEAPIRGADETYPYPTRFGNAYARTKALAEQAVLRADGSPRAKRKSDVGSDEPVLRTCVIRPCGMFGEADPYHVSHFLRAVQAGQLPFRIGDGRAVFQHVYVGNVAHAHALAVRSLLSPAPAAAGQAYFVTDVPAVNFFEFMEPIVAGLGLSMPPRSRRVPYRLVYAIGALLEGAARLARPFVAYQPTLTRTSVKIVCEDFRIESDKAARQLGYAPVYPLDEALERTVAWFRENGPL